MRLKFILGLYIGLAFVGCSSDNNDVENTLSILSATINGASLNSTVDNIQPQVEVVVVFSAGVDINKIKHELVLTTNNGDVVSTDFSFANNQSKATISAELDYNTSYSIDISTRPIGSNNEVLKEPFHQSFTTAEDDIVRSLPPCTGSGNCLQTKSFSNGGSANFQFYSSYPIYTDNAEWENLRQAIIVVHGQNRDANNYYNYLTNTLSTNELQDNTVLIAPWFKSEGEASSDEFYWTSSDWREGQPSDNDVHLSSFAIIDSLISQLANKDKFPVMEKIIVTGHSSGGLFTHVYAASNRSENIHTSLTFDYVVANSQYFYYANNFRYDEDTDAFFEPDNCVGFNYWPLGYNNTPDYLSGVSEATFNDQFTARKIIYLLGNGNASDPSLNTSDCGATLLGSSRYHRGENIFAFMNKYYTTTHNHEKVIVNGISHDGQGMYSSSEFNSLLATLSIH